MKIFGYEFIIKEVNKKKAKGFSSKKWSVAEKNTLLRFHGENKSAVEIAKLLNRTVPSINTMLSKLKNGK